MIPVILRSADWEGAPFTKLQALPRDGKPINRWADEDAAWTDVVQGIRQVARQLGQDVLKEKIGHYEPE